MFVALDSDVLGESRSRKLVSEGDEGLVPDAPNASTPRSPYPGPIEVRLDASRKEAARGGAFGPPPPTGKRSCKGGRPDRRLRREERRETASASMVVEATLGGGSSSVTSSCSCSTLIACLSAARPDARMREAGRLACVMVEVEAKLCWEMDGVGSVLEGGCGGKAADCVCDGVEVRAGTAAVAGDGRPREAESEAGLSAAEV